MGKIIFWIVIFFLVLLALRLVNLANNAKRRDNDGNARPRERPRELTAEPTVRCADCGTYLPKADAKPFGGGYRCGDPDCPRKR